MKRKHLLILAFIIVSTVPIFASLQYLNNTTRNFSQQQFENHLSAMSLIAKKRILTAVDRIKDNIALISSRTQMRISLAQWNQSRNIADQQKITKIIKDAQQGLAHIKAISIYDQQARLVASTMPTAGPKKLEFQSASKASISLSPESDAIIALGQQPLVLNHQRVGYIRITFFADFITDLVRDRIGLGETGEWLFAVRHESGDALFAVPLKYDHQAAFKRRVPKNRLDVPIIQALLGNEKIMYAAPDYRDEPVLASTRYLSELDWGLVAKVNESEVSQLVNKSRTLSYIIEGMVIFLAIIIGVVLKGFSKDLQITVKERTKELDEENKVLEILATHDSLTGLDNRRKFEERFSKEFHRAKRYKHKLTVVIFDIDHFKFVNDTYGHAIGDEVLKNIAEYLKSTVRDSDIVARIGGEEFCLVLPESTLEDSWLLVERTRADIANIACWAGDKQFHVTCSFGIAHLKDSIQDTGTLLNQADSAMYQAKQSGRNCIIQYSSDDADIADAVH